MTNNGIKGVTKASKAKGVKGDNCIAMCINSVYRVEKVTTKITHTIIVKYIRKFVLALAIWVLNFPKFIIIKQTE